MIELTIVCVALIALIVFREIMWARERNENFEERKFLTNRVVARHAVDAGRLDVVDQGNELVEPNPNMRPLGDREQVGI